jgi:hypothetical protein
MIDKPQLRELDRNLLGVFDAVLRERSVGRAAHHLGLSQPAVSHALSRLRQALDDELFVRNGSGMQPTPRALELAQPVREGLELLQDAVAPPAFAPEQATRCFRLALSDYVSTVILGKLVRALRAQAPGIDLRILRFGATIAGQLSEDEQRMPNDLPDRYGSLPILIAGCLHRLAQFDWLSRHIARTIKGGEQSRADLLHRADRGDTGKCRGPLHRLEIVVAHHSVPDFYRKGAVVRSLP